MGFLSTFSGVLYELKDDLKVPTYFKTTMDFLLTFSGVLHEELKDDLKVPNYFMQIVDSRISITCKPEAII
jgi:hypothetical protein